MPLRHLSEDDVPHLGSPSLEDITWSPVSGYKGLENDVVIVAGVTDIEADWRDTPQSAAGHRFVRNVLCRATPT